MNLNPFAFFKRRAERKRQEQEYRKKMEEYYASLPDDGTPPGLVWGISIDKDGKTCGSWR